MKLFGVLVLVRLIFRRGGRLSGVMVWLSVMVGIFMVV